MGVRSTVRDLDQQAVYLALLVSSVLHLARTIAGPGGDKLPTPVHAVLTDLAAGTGLADADPTAANEHAAAARATASTLQSAACGSNEVVRADIVQACVTDLQRVIERPGRRACQPELARNACTSCFGACISQASVINSSRSRTSISASLTSTAG